MGTFTYDLTTDAGKVRLLIADTNWEKYDFDDDEVAVALDLEDDSIKRAGATLLLALAGNRARLAVSVRRGSVSEDLTRVADELRKQAAELKAQADTEEDVPLQAVISPSYERFSYTTNLLLERDDEDGNTEVLTAP